MSISNRGSIILILACLAGCATTYTSSNPSNLPPEQFATVEQVDPIHSGVLIDHVDGKWLDPGQPGFISSPPGSIP